MNKEEKKQDARFRTLRILPHSFLLPLFLVLNGLNYFYGLVKWSTALKVAAVLIIISVSFFLLIRWKIGDPLKSALITSWTAFPYLFFGAIHDGLKNIFPESWVAYRYFIPFCFLAWTGGLAWLLRTPAGLGKITAYLNILLVFLCGYEAVKLVLHRPENEKYFQYPPANLQFHASNRIASPAPDIYFLVFDSYLRSDALREEFGMDNAGMDSFLFKSGFHTIPWSRSDYNNTTYSLVSVLNMNLLNTDSLFNALKPDFSYPTCLRLIEKNVCFEIFKQSGYKIVNGSLFNLEDQPASFSQPYLPSDQSLLLSKSLPDKLLQDIFPLEGIVKYNLGFLKKKYVYGVDQYNKNVARFLESEIRNSHTGPRLVYIHFLMPHAPYYYDSAGKYVPPEELLDVGRFPGYMAYTNSQIRKYVQSILDATHGNAVILLISDHGLKLKRSKGPAPEFRNLFSIYFPDQAYAGISDSLSIVNTFRIVLNKYFDQHYSMLP